MKFRVQQIKVHAGIATHLDMPAHCTPGGKTAEQIPISKLVAPCVVIDVSENCNENYKVSIEDIKKFEDKCGHIKKGTFVIIKTGWERFWNNAEQYRNNHVFPTVSKEAADLLFERNVCGLGIDTMSPDLQKEGTFYVHKLFLGHDKYIVENIANIDSLPIINSFIMIMPIKIKGLTEAPVRLFGLVDI